MAHRRRAQSGRLSSKFSFALFLAPVFLFAASLPSLAQTVTIDPNSMLVEGKAVNRFVVSSSPGFRWTFPGPGTQTNWQIQVDSDPNFNGHNGEIWFWDSGIGNKGGLEGATNIPFSVVTAPGKPSRPIDNRASLIYWRVRVQVNNDQGWPGNSPWSASFFKKNQIPSGNESMNAAADPNPGIVLSNSNFPAIRTGTKEFFVSTTGSDSNPGTQASPFRTINRGARALSPGDTLTVRGGVYNENVRLVPGTGGVRTGEPGNPITIRNFPNEIPTVRSIQGGTAPIAPLAILSSGGTVHYWTIDGLRFGGSSSTIGVEIQRGEHVTLKHISFDGTFNPFGIGVRIDGGGQGNRVLDSVFDKQMFDQVEVLGSKAPEIRGNVFTGGNGHVAIHYHNTGSESGTISDNVFHDFTSTEGAIFLYLSADGTTVRNNVVYGVRQTSGGYAAAVVVMRCGKVLIENNTFVRNERGIGFLEFSRFITVRNNILVGNGVAFDFRPTQSARAGETALGTVIENNLTFNNGVDLDIFHPSDLALITQTNNKFGQDPQFVSLDPSASSPYSSNDLHLAPGSPAINAGKAGIAVPFGGGATIDIGAFESGAVGNPPYEYQPSVPAIGDNSPRITFGYIDRDIDLNALEPITVPDISQEVSVGIELELDTSNRFDSVGGNRPIFATGVLVPYFDLGYTIPDANALPPGLYYVRVRQRDFHQATFDGGWSSNNFRIQVGAGAPVLSQQNPADGAVGVSPTTNVTAHILEFTSGVDLNSIVVSYGVNDATAPDPATNLQVVPVGGQLDDVMISFNPSQLTALAGGDVITVRVQADSLSAGAPSMDSKYSFTLADTTPPPAPANFRTVP